MKAKNQRLTLLALAVAAVLGAVLLAMSALKDQAAYFYTPGDIAREGVPLGRAVRIGGMVQAGSLQRAADGVTLHFLVKDETPHKIRVRFRGIVPEGRGRFGIRAPQQVMCLLRCMDTGQRLTAFSA